MGRQRSHGRRVEPELAIRVVLEQPEPPRVGELGESAARRIVEPGAIGVAVVGHHVHCRDSHATAQFPFEPVEVEAVVDHGDGVQLQSGRTEGLQSTEVARVGNGDAITCVGHHRGHHRQRLLAARGDEHVIRIHRSELTSGLVLGDVPAQLRVALRRRVLQHVTPSCETSSCGLGQLRHGKGARLGESTCERQHAGGTGVGEQVADCRGAHGSSAAGNGWRHTSRRYSAPSVRSVGIRPRAWCCAYPSWRSTAGARSIQGHPHTSKGCTLHATAHRSASKAVRPL